MTISIGTWVSVGAIAAAVGLAGVQTIRLANEQVRHANTVSAYAGEKFRASELHKQAESEQRLIYEARIKEKDNVVKSAQDLAASRAAALVVAKRDASGLRSDLAAYIARNSQASGNPSTGTGGETASTPARMLGGLFEEADSFAERVASALAASRDAGLTCQRQYESLDQ